MWLWLRAYYMYGYGYRRTTTVDTGLCVGIDVNFLWDTYTVCPTMEHQQHWYKREWPATIPQWPTLCSLLFQLQLSIDCRTILGRVVQYHCFVWTGIPSIQRKGTLHTFVKAKCKHSHTVLYLLFLPVSVCHTICNCVFLSMKYMMISEDKCRWNDSVFTQVLGKNRPVGNGLVARKRYSHTSRQQIEVASDFDEQRIEILAFVVHSTCRPPF